MFPSHARASVVFGAVLCAALVFPTAVGAATHPNVAVPVADYQFQNTRTSSDAGAPALTDIGTNGNTFATETVDGTSHTVLAFPLHHGLSLTPTTGLVASNQYSIVILVRFKQVDGYRRLVDFKNGSSDTGLYDDAGTLDFYNDAGGTKTPIKANQYFQVVLTRSSATKTVVGYVNGAQQFSFKDTLKDGVISSKNTLRFFADDRVVNHEDAGGAVARIRLYTSVLTPAEVAALDREPAG